MKTMTRNTKKIPFPAWVREAVQVLDHLDLVARKVELNETTHRPEHIVARVEHVDVFGYQLQVLNLLEVSRHGGFENDVFVNYHPVFTIFLLEIP